MIAWDDWKMPDTTYRRRKQGQLLRVVMAWGAVGWMVAGALALAWWAR